MIQILDVNIISVTYPFPLDESFSKTSFFVSFYRKAETIAVSFFFNSFFTSSKEMDMYLTVAYGGPSSWVFTYCKKAYRTLGGKPPRPPSYPPTYVSIYGIPITYDQQLLISKMKIYLLTQQS